MTNPDPVLLPWRGPGSVLDAAMRAIAVRHPDLVGLDVELRPTAEGLWLVPAGSETPVKAMVPLVVESREGSKG